MTRPHFESASLTPPSTAAVVLDRGVPAASADDGWSDRSRRRLARARRKSRPSFVAEYRGSVACLVGMCLRLADGSERYRDQMELLAVTTEHELTRVLAQRPALLASWSRQALMATANA